jgi:hypothetical protein
MHRMYEDKSGHATWKGRARTRTESADGEGVEDDRLLVGQALL